MLDPTTDRARSRARLWTSAALLVLMGAVVYATGLSGPFIFDDGAAIEENPNIRTLWPLWTALGAPSQSPVAGRPVVSLSLALNYALGGLSVFGYRLVNLGVHILCALALFGVIRRSLLRPRLRARFGETSTALALASASLWMLHPMQTEVVAYVTQRTESIMALFYLLTLYCSIRALDSDRRGAWSTAAVAACALGMSSKEVMVTAPLMVVLYDGLMGSWSARDQLRRRWTLYLGLAATWSILAALTIDGPRSATIGFDHGVGAIGYLLNQAEVVVSYLRLAVWPHPLLLDYGQPVERSLADVWPQFALLVALCAATLAAMKRDRPLALLGLWFFLILAPTSSVIPIASEVGAERRMYLPLAALVVLAVLSAHRLLARRHTWLAPVLAGTVGLALAGATWHRNLDYRSEVKIWTSVVGAAPHNARGYVALGASYSALEMHDEAMRMYRRALEISPGMAIAHYNLGATLTSLGRYGEAIGYIERTIEIQPAHADAYYALGLIHHGVGRLDLAIGALRHSLHLKPEAEDTRRLLADTMRLVGSFGLGEIP